jgi:hypothetical protein
MAARYKPFYKRARGSIAVEMALILPLFLVLLAGPLYIARAAWFYSAAQKAAHDATRYMATATQAEMRTGGSGFNEARVPAVARWIAQEELGEIVPFTETIAITLLCAGAGCATLMPADVHTRIEIGLQDNLLGDLTEEFLGVSDMTMISNVTMRYVGQ